MPARKHPQVVTANRLRDGVVIYMTADKSWTEQFAHAHPIGLDDDVEPWVAKAEADETARIVVAIYPFDVTIRDGQIAPISAREFIRAFGPTARTDTVDTQTSSTGSGDTPAQH